MLEPGRSLFYGGNLILRVFCMPVLYSTVSKLLVHLKYNSLRFCLFQKTTHDMLEPGCSLFNGRSLLLRVFYMPILYSTSTVYKLHLKHNFYSIQITFEIQFPPFLFISKKNHSCHARTWS